MNTKLMLSSKVSWEIDNAKTWEESFYPSTVEKIKSSQEYYDSLFSVSFEKLTQDEYLQQFYPLYVKQIASRDEYTLNLNEQRDLILKRIVESDPIAMFGKVIQRSTKSFIGGAIFSLWNDRISIVHRVFDREINKQYKKNTTIDYWFESKFREFTRTLNQPIVTHGHDPHPFTSRVGLAEFKMRVSGLPYAPRNNFPLTQINLEDLKNTDQLLLYFDDLVERKYTKAVIISTSQTNPGVLNSCKAVLDWTELKKEYIHLD